MDLFYRYSYLFRCFITALVLSLSLTPTLAIANSATYTFSHSLPQKINNQLLKASYTFTNKISGASTVIAKQLTKPQVVRLLTFVISRRFAAFAALGTIAAEAGMSTIDVDGKSLIVQKLPQTDIINVLTTGNNEYVPLSGNVLNLNYCAAGLAQLNHLYPAMHYIPANSANWCELVNISSTYKELSLTLSTVEDPVSTTKVTVAPTQVDKKVIPQPIPDYAVVNPDVLGETIFNKAKPADLSPLFDYTEVYQSPAAIEAIDEYNNTKGEAFPTYPDITTPSLDKPVTTPNNSNLDLPTFCNWATPICSFVEWFKDDSAIPEPEKHEVREFDKSKLPTSPEFNFKANCPVPKTFNINLGMASTQISLPYDYFCSFAIDVRPFVILAAWLNACYIFVGFVRS